MNIFVLSQDPKEAAQMQCDRHVVKMTLETAQILCAVFEPGSAPYKRTHYKHPCAIWANSSLGNYLWLCKHGLALAEEYSFRYQKEHKSHAVIRWCEDHLASLKFPRKNRTPFAVVMPEEYRQESVIDSYRNFYCLSKSRFAKWQRGRATPSWFTPNQ